MIVRILENRWVELALRCLLGGVFVYAGWMKITSPQSFADSIATFHLLPPPLINLLVLWLPLFEIALGVLLAAGQFKRVASLGILLMTVMFALALTSALARGLSVDCGCFGSKGASVYQGWISLGRDLLIGSFAFKLYTRKYVGNACLYHSMKQRFI